MHRLIACCLGGLVGLAAGGCADEEGILEPGVYALSPENRDLRFEVLDDGSFYASAFEWDLSISARGSVVGLDSRTLLVPPDGDDTFDWSTTEGFIVVEQIEFRLESGAYQATLARMDGTERLQRFVESEEAVRGP